MKTPKKRKLIWGSLLISFILVLGAGSRTAFISCLVGTLVFYYTLYNHAKTLIVRIAFSIAVFLCVTFPLWSPSFQIIKSKNHGQVIRLDTSSRENLWKAHWNLFLKHPITGVGFSCVTDEDSKTGANFASGQIETGSSWVTVLLMTGIFGGLIICCILFKTYLTLRKNFIRCPLTVSLLSALLAAYCVHMLAEGYIFAAGNIFCFDFWLLLGTIQALDSPAQISVKNDEMAFSYKRLLTR